MKFGDTEVKNKWIVIGICAILLFWIIGSYNGLVDDKVTIDQKLGQVQNVYQRRADLIPNLVEVVKGYAGHENSTLKAVTEARASATKITLAPGTSPEEMVKWQAAQGQLSAALGKLMMLKEAYPDLKANQNFLQLQAQVEGTENRITTERRQWQLAIAPYNKKVQKFPSSIIAGAFGFKAYPFFEAEAGSKVAPKIKF